MPLIQGSKPEGSEGCHLRAKRSQGQVSLPSQLLSQGWSRERHGSPLGPSCPRRVATGGKQHNGGGLHRLPEHPQSQRSPELLNLVAGTDLESRRLQETRVCRLPKSPMLSNPNSHRESALRFPFALPPPSQERDVRNRLPAPPLAGPGAARG